MPASLAIHALRARIPARAQPVAARLALQALGADLEDALPRGLPPQALLWLRHLHLHAPEAALLRPAPPAWRRDWVAAGRERLDAALAHAARPALGPVAEDAEAVLFADAAEMLACLALAARTGQLDRWWWRGLLGRAWPVWQTAWAARPQAQAAAQRLLQRAGQARAAAFDAGVVPSAVPPPLRPAAPAGVEAPRGSAVAGDAVAAATLPQGAAAALGLPEAGPATQAAVAAKAGGARPAAVVPERTAEVAGEVAPVVGESARVMVNPFIAPGPPGSLRRAAIPPEPRVVATRTAPLPPDATVAPAAAWLPPAEARARQPDATAITSSEDGPLQTARAIPAHATPAPAQPASPAPVEATRTAEPVSAPGAALAANAPGLVPKAVPPAPLADPMATELQAVPAPLAAEAAWPWPQAVLSQQAPLLFLVNALLVDGLYPDFTRPRDPGLPVPLWALLLGLAEAWRLPVDPLHAALTERAGAWQRAAVLPAAPGAPAGAWQLWLPAYARTLRRRLCRRLGWRAARWPGALALAHPARLWLSEAEWVAEFDLAGHDVAWRLAGLDRDPGWLPSVDCSLRFEFR